MNVLTTINDALARRTTRFAFELLPPLKGDGTKGVFAAVDNVVEYDPAYINGNRPISCLLYKSDAADD